MWKSYNRFYTQIIKSEAGFLFLSKNVYKVPYVKKASLACASKNPITVKSTLMTLSGLQLAVNRKTFITTAQKSRVVAKIRKGNPLGSKVSFFGDGVYQIAHMMSLKLLPQLELVNFLRCNDKSFDFIFFIKSPMIFYRLVPFFNYFQSLPPLQVVLSAKGLYCSKKALFWRLFKLPINFSKKTG